MGAVPVRPQAVESVAKAMHEATRGRMRSWDKLFETVREVARIEARAAIDAFLATEEIEAEYELRPDEDEVEPARHVRLCGPWRRDDGD